MLTGLLLSSPSAAAAPRAGRGRVHGQERRHRRRRLPRARWGRRTSSARRDRCRRVSTRSTKRGRELSDAQRFPGFVCRIAGKPSQRSLREHVARVGVLGILARRAGRNAGATARSARAAASLPPGTFEGWSFSLNKVAATRSLRRGSPSPAAPDVTAPSSTATTARRTPTSCPSTTTRDDDTRRRRPHRRPRPTPHAPTTLRRRRRRLRDDRCDDDGRGLDDRRVSTTADRHDRRRGSRRPLADVLPRRRRPSTWGTMEVMEDARPRSSSRPPWSSASAPPGVVMARKRASAADAHEPALERLPRELHPVAWWIWALGMATAATRTTNPLLLGCDHRRRRVRGLGSAWRCALELRVPRLRDRRARRGRASASRCARCSTGSTARMCSSIFPSCPCRRRRKGSASADRSRSRGCSPRSTTGCGLRR